MSKHTLGSGPVEPKYVAAMAELARMIDKFFNRNGPRETGFILMVFPFDGEPGRCNYLSNAERGDVVVLLKEQLAYLEGHPDTQSGHA